MKKIFLSVMIFFLYLFAHWGSVIAQQKVPSPKMVIKEKVFNYGEVNEGVTIEHSFKILNVGEKPLNIRKVKPG